MDPNSANHARTAQVSWADKGALALLALPILVLLLAGFWGVRIRRERFQHGPSVEATLTSYKPIFSHKAHANATVRFPWDAPDGSGMCSSTISIGDGRPRNIGDPIEVVPLKGSCGDVMAVVPRL